MIKLRETIPNAKAKSDNISLLVVTFHDPFDLVELRGWHGTARWAWVEYVYLPAEETVCETLQQADTVNRVSRDRRSAANGKSGQHDMS